VPWWRVAVLHKEESNLDFGSYLHNGEPLAVAGVQVARKSGAQAAFFFRRRAAVLIAASSLASLSR
jgi:lysozyme family protein